MQTELTDEEFLNALPTDGNFWSTEEKRRCKEIAKGTKEIERLTAETWNLGTERDELKAKVKAMEAVVEVARKLLENVPYSRSVDCRTSNIGPGNKLADAMFNLDASPSQPDEKEAERMVGSESSGRL